MSLDKYVRFSQDGKGGSREAGKGGSRGAGNGGSRGARSPLNSFLLSFLIFIFLLWQTNTSISYSMHCTLQ